MSVLNYSSKLGAKITSFNQTINQTFFGIKLIHIYGIQKKYPLKEKFETNNPIQLYAATKKSNEVIAASYNNLFGIKTIGLRFFTVYGPWGRPDMALFKFTKNILRGKPIHVFNFGNHSRDFTYVDDIVEGIFKILISKDKKNINNVYNLGCGKKVPLSNLIDSGSLRGNSKRWAIKIEKLHSYLPNTSKVNPNNEPMWK